VEVTVNCDPSGCALSISSTEVIYTIGVVNIQEWDTYSHVVSFFDFTNWSFNPSNPSSQYSTWSAQTTLENAAEVMVIIYYFHNMTSVQFANKTSMIAAHTMKLEIQVQNWPFKSLSNSLVILLSSRQNGSSQIYDPTKISQTKIDSNGNLNWFIANTNGSEIYGQFESAAVVDGRVRSISYKLNENGSVLVTTPHFWYSLDVDPSYSVLTSTPEDKQTAGFAALYIYLLVAAGVLLIVTVVAYPFVKTYFQTKRAQVEILKELELEETL